MNDGGNITVPPLVTCCSLIHSPKLISLHIITVLLEIYNLLCLSLYIIFYFMINIYSHTNGVIRK